MVYDSSGKASCDRRDREKEIKRATNTFFDIEEEEPKKKTKGKIIEV